MAKMIGRMMTSAEFELKGAKEYVVIENAEIVSLLALTFIESTFVIYNSIYFAKPNHC
jgi:hypothetical protein